MQDSALDSLVAARHAVLADLAQSARPGTPAEADASFMHGDVLSTANMSASSSRGNPPVLDPLMQARALVRTSTIRELLDSTALLDAPNYLYARTDMQHPLTGLL